MLLTQHACNKDGPLPALPPNLLSGAELREGTQLLVRVLRDLAAIKAVAELPASDRPQAWRQAQRRGLAPVRTALLTLVAHLLAHPG